MVSVHWNTLLNHSHCLLGKVVSMHVKNSAVRVFQEEKKVKAENTEWARGKKRRRIKKFELVPPPQPFHALHESYLMSSSSFKYKLVPVLFFSEPLSPSHRCAREWGGEDPWCQRRWCMEGVFWWDSPRDRGWICNALWHWVNIPGHDVRCVSCVP